MTLRDRLESSTSLEKGNWLQRWTDRWTEERTDGQIDGQTDATKYIISKIRGR